MTSEPTRPMGGRQRWPLVPSLWSPPYIGVKCGPLPQRNLLQTIAGKRPEQFFFFISPASALHHSGYAPWAAL